MDSNEELFVDLEEVGPDKYRTIIIFKQSFLFQVSTEVKEENQFDKLKVWKESGWVEVGKVKSGLKREPTKEDIKASATEIALQYLFRTLIEGRQD